MCQTVSQYSPGVADVVITHGNCTKAGKSGGVELFLNRWSSEEISTMSQSASICQA